MNKRDVTALLEAVRNGSASVEEAAAKFEAFPFANREISSACPEVIFCEGKTAEQIQKIVKSFLEEENTNIFAARASENVYKAIRGVCPEAVYNEPARTVSIIRRNISLTESYIAIVCAGTSDIAVAEEAAETARVFGNRVKYVSDLGMAGIRRLFARIDVIRGAKVIIVAAGMDGALASVVAGLVDKPVIAIPTSSGCGATFEGLPALLGMVNSCSAGVSVVNVNNGFGAAYCASVINKL
ncbi:MAG: nickel pincer cofactor biosynthesis protein LarB [Oscillospiraceae bacterium]|jgi:NCAIR mutase (PurE)-related protein|nr:nickel pincer cofactor biosynthesis protein LarB [Oscillospiraceae bacterium]